MLESYDNMLSDEAKDSAGKHQSKRAPIDNRQS
jgi:hypothetical protein